VTLAWHSGTNEIVASVWDRGMSTHFEIRPEPHLALDAYYHPYSYLPRLEACCGDERFSLQADAGSASDGDGCASRGATAASARRRGGDASSGEAAAASTSSAHPWMFLLQGEAARAGCEPFMAEPWSTGTAPVILFSVATLIAFIAFMTWLGLELFST
jgi:hypothetical protein